MSGFLLDTNILSEFNRRGEPDRLVKQWLEAADTETLLRQRPHIRRNPIGVELLPPSKRRTQLEQWLERDLHDWFEGRILPVDESIANRWGMLCAQAQLKGRSLSVVDALLAATALQHNLTGRVTERERFLRCRARRGQPVGVEAVNGDGELGIMLRKK